jgi:hypothetical protein
MLNLLDITVEDFSGGITDYRFGAAPNQSYILDNYLINPNRKPYQRFGSAVFDPDMVQLPDGEVRVTSIFSSSVLSEVFFGSGRKIWYPDGTFTELLGPTSNPVFSAGSDANFNSFAEYNETMYATNDALSYPVKIYKDGSGDLQIRTAGLPSLASNPSVVSSGGSGNNYVYAFLYFYEYTAGSVLFQDFGPTVLVELSNAGAPEADTVNITSIPVLANSTTLNYDTSNIKVHIYRTENNGITFYKVGEVTNGTTTFNDNVADTTIINNLLLYTNGGVLDNDPPPKAKYVHVVNSIGYFCHVQEGSEVFKNRVRQSIIDDIDSCPVDCYVDVPDEIVGVSSYNDNPLIFTKSRVVRLNGYINELGQGQITYEDITKNIGCFSHRSIVQTRFGVFWAGIDGFYWTNGFDYKKISDSINDRYKNATDTVLKQSRIYGTYDNNENRVYFGVQCEQSSSDNDCIFALDLRWGIREESTFTTMSNGTYFAPTALAFYNGDLLRGDYRGYILKHNDSYRSDVMIDDTSSPADWDQAAIVPLYRSTILDFGIPKIRKFVPKILTTFQNQTNIAVQISAVNDNTSTQRDCYPIRYRNNILWGDETVIWGDESLLWNFQNDIEEIRRFPARGLRCSKIEIIIQPSFTNIYRSDSVCPATVDDIAKTATLDDLSLAFPSSLVDLYITFEADDYEKQYRITERNSATEITFQDTTNSSPTGSQKWVIRGIPKNEVINPISYVLYYAPLTDQSFKTYRSEQDSSGGNT